MKKIFEQLKSKLYAVAMLPTILLSPPKDSADLTRADIVEILKNITNYLIDIVGFVVGVFLLIGAYQYITSMGNEEQAKKAKSTLTWSIIGAIIVVSAYAIVKLVFEKLVNDPKTFFK